MMDRINYNHVKNIVKSALFPSQAHSEEEEPHECRVYKLDDYRARKQEKTRQN